MGKGMALAIRVAAAVAARMFDHPSPPTLAHLSRFT
jgi:hypothetical protein